MAFFRVFPHGGPVQAAPVPPPPPSVRVQLTAPGQYDPSYASGFSGIMAECYPAAAGAALGLDAAPDGTGDPAKAEAAAAFRRVLDWMTSADGDQPGPTHDGDGGEIGPAP